MTEYIDRESLRNAVESIDWYSVFRGKLTVGAKSSENPLYKANDIYSAIDNAPTADVAPVQHGRWLTWEEKFPGEKPRRSNNLGVFCDKCNTHADNRTDFCPNCGAKMDGGIGNA